MILFGVSNMLSDVYECISLLGKKVTRLIINVPENMRERTKDFETRLLELNEKPLITPLENFTPEENEEYFVVPVTPQKHLLVEYLKNNYQLQFAHLIHPTAYVSPYAKIGQGVFIGARSVISPGCIMGDHVFVNHGVTVGHDTIIHDYARLNPGSNIAGHVEIFNSVMIGLGATVIEELVIGKDAVVAAGAVVIRDVKENTMVAGVPAIIKKVYNRRASNVDGHIKKVQSGPPDN
jgi:sugar O-acyltransferase (sialic acid O-acetyltransferase NeuD family)